MGVSMKGIRKRGDSYLVDVTVQGKRHTTTVHSLDEAIRTRDRMREAARLGKPVTVVKGASSSMSLKKAYEATYRTKWRGSRAEKHVEINWRLISGFFGPNLGVQEVTREKVDEFIAFCQDGRKHTNSTLNKKLSTLRMILKTAQEYGAIESMPRIPFFREGKGRIRYITWEEEDAILETFRGWGMSPMVDAVVVLVDTGVRVSELLRIEGRDITDDGEVHVWKTKNDRPRTLPMTPRVAETLKRRQEVHGKGKLFPDLTKGQLNRGWQRMREHIGLDDDPQFVPHVLRHTCASRLVQAGANLEVVRQWMGHTTLHMTQRYGHLAPTSLQGARAALERPQEA